MSPFLLGMSSSSLIFLHPLPTTDKQHVNSNSEYYKVLLCTLHNNLQIMYCIFRHSLQSKRSPYVELMTDHSCLILMPKPPDRSFLESDITVCTKVCWASETRWQWQNEVHPAWDHKCTTVYRIFMNIQDFDMLPMCTFETKLRNISHPKVQLKVSLKTKDNLSAASSMSMSMSRSAVCHAVQTVLWAIFVHILSSSGVNRNGGTQSLANTWEEIIHECYMKTVELVQLTYLRWNCHLIITTDFVS